MLPVVIAGVVLGDGLLYGMGRLWGTWLLSRQWVQRRLVSPEKRAEIEKNFHDRGIAVLLGARLLPGIRTPIFLMAGVLRVPLGRFLLADGLYAIPGVNLLFWISYLLTDQVLEIFNRIDAYRPQVASPSDSSSCGRSRLENHRTCRRSLRSRRKLSSMPSRRLREWWATWLTSGIITR
jgi:hypothetical protein